MSSLGRAASASGALATPAASARAPPPRDARPPRGSERGAACAPVAPRKGEAGREQRAALTMRPGDETARADELETARSARFTPMTPLSTARAQLATPMATARHQRAAMTPAEKDEQIRSLRDEVQRLRARGHR